MVLVVPAPVQAVDLGEVRVDVLYRAVATPHVPQLDLALVGAGQQLATDLVPLYLGGPGHRLEVVGRPLGVPHVPDVDVGVGAAGGDQVLVEPVPGEVGDHAGVGPQGVV